MLEEQKQETTESLLNQDETLTKNESESIPNQDDTSVKSESESTTAEPDEMQEEKNVKNKIKASMGL